MQVGQKVVIASNSLDSQQAEELAIAAVSSGNRITLMQPLKYDHTSFTMQDLPSNILSAELGLVDRSISISSSSGQGAFVLVKGNATAVLQNLACFKCGQVRLWDCSFQEFVAMSFAQCTTKQENMQKLLKNCESRCIQDGVGAENVYNTMIA